MGPNEDLLRPPQWASADAGHGTFHRAPHWARPSAGCGAPDGGLIW